MVALGSRDRSFSVWSTNLRRPLFVVTDAFDQSVLDLAWSRDGRVLIACSMDGTVAAVVLKEEELGRPMSEERRRDMMAKMYGKGFGLPATVKAAKQHHETNGTGPVVVENPELLLKSSKDTSTKQQQQQPKKLQPKGPTDKQIEARTSDGKRRITPIFIPPDESSQGFGTGEFQSLSTKETSRIEIEKREGVVKPNVSPNAKKNLKGSSASSSSGATAGAGLSSNSNSNSVPTSKTKEDVDEASDDDGVNVIQIRRKPRKMVITSSDEEEDGDREKKTSSKEVQKDDEPSAKLKELTQSRPNLLVAKRKGENGEESPRPKKRGRPPLNRSREEEQDTATVAKAREEDPDKRQEAVAAAPIVVRSSSAALSGSAVLPPALITRPRNLTFSPASAGGAKASVQVVNWFSKEDDGSEAPLHLVKFTRPRDSTVLAERAEESSVVRVLLPSPVNSVNVACSSELVVLTCLDASLHLFAAGGQRLFPPIMLPSPVSNVSVSGDTLAAVTTVGRFFLWRFCKDRGYAPAAAVRNECILSLLERGTGGADEESGEDASPVTVARLCLNSGAGGVATPVIVTSVGRSFLFDESVGAWLRLADADSPVAAASSFSSYSLDLAARKTEPSPSSPSLPLASISLSTRSRVVRKFPPASSAGEERQLRCLADTALCEERLSAARYLNSPSEYRHWLVALVKRLTEAGGSEAEARLRDLLDPLLREQDKKILGQLDRRDVLREALGAVGHGGVAFQRLCSEYRERLEVEGAKGEGGNDSISDLNGLLHGDGDFEMKEK